MIFWVLVIAYFVQNGVSDLAFHWRGEESPRDARRASRQKAVTDWASGRKAGRKSHPPATPKAGKSGPWREYFRDLNADCAAGATERRRAMRDNRKARRARRKTRKAEALPTEVAATDTNANETPRSVGTDVPAWERAVNDRVVDVAREHGYDGPIDQDGHLLPDVWCVRVDLHGTGRMCGKPTDGGPYCSACLAEINAPPNRCPECGDRDHPAHQCEPWPEPDQPVDHGPPTEREPAPPEDDRPQPVADQPAQPEQPQTSAAEPKGTTMPDISAAEGGITASIVYCEQMIDAAQQAQSSLETSAGALENGGWVGDAPGGMRQASDAFTAVIAHLERSKAALIAGLSVREAYEAAPDTGDKESVLQG